MKINNSFFENWHTLQFFLLCCGLCMCHSVDLTAARLGSDTTVYVVAGKAPQFEGNMNEWIVENIRYPRVAWDDI